MTKDFSEFMTRRRQVATAYVNGDPGPLREISTATDPATFLGPGGGIVQGSEAVLTGNEAGSHQFAPGGVTELEVLHQAADGNLAYWTGWQTANVKMKGKSDPVLMKLRVTEVFRREAGDWKLVHRHADPLAGSRSPG